MDQQNLTLQTDPTLRTQTPPQKRRQIYEDDPDLSPDDGCKHYKRQRATNKTTPGSSLISRRTRHRQPGDDQNRVVEIERYTRKGEGFTGDEDNRSLITECGSYYGFFEPTEGDESILGISVDGSIECHLEETAVSHLIPPTHMEYEDSDCFIKDICKCFGMLLITDVYLLPGFFHDSDREITIDGLSIRDLKSKTYIGMLGETVGIPLVKLSSKYPICLFGFIIAEKQISVHVYGAQSDAASVGRLLIQEKLWLQHPDLRFVPQTFYQNPQWLNPQESDSLAWKHHLEQVSPTEAPLKLNSTCLPVLSTLLDRAIGPEEFAEPQSNDMVTTQLLTYQKKALAMMIEKESGIIKGEGAEFETLWESMEDSHPSAAQIFRNTVTGFTTTQRPNPCLGGLLADEMGLGKTLTVLALICRTIQNHHMPNRRRNANLIIVPLSTLSNWKDQIKRHLKPRSLKYTVYHGQKRQMTSDILQRFDVVLTTYDTLKADFRPQRNSGRGCLLHQFEWYRVILDEAHIIRNRSPHLQCLRLLKGKHRWCLTGTPIQNRIEDLGALVEFLRVSPFDNMKIFQDQFVKSVRNEPSERLRRLRLLVNAISLRRTKEGVLGELNLQPPKRVYQPVQLDNSERGLYDLLKQLCIRGVGPLSSTKGTFQLILRLRQVCNHGLDLLPCNIRQWLELNSFTFDAPFLSNTYCENCAKQIDNGEAVAPACLHQVCAGCKYIAIEAGEGDSSSCPVCLGSQSLKSGDNPKSDGDGLACSTYRPSSKVKALLYNLEKDREPRPPGKAPIKSIIFSEWITMLDLVGQALQLNGFSFERIDGQKTLPQRDKSLEKFRNNYSCNILLATLGSAGIGVDLSAASRVHLLEPNWNPMLEQQALDRVHRLGQNELVVTTCYYIAGDDSVEEYVKQKQRWKRHIASSSFSDTPPISQSQYMSFLCNDLMTMLQGAVS